jgi:hypothetical protein
MYEPQTTTFTQPTHDDVIKYISNLIVVYGTDTKRAFSAFHEFANYEHLLPKDRHYFFGFLCEKMGRMQCH